MYYAKIPSRGALCSARSYDVRGNLVAVNHKHYSTEVTSNNKTIVILKTLIHLRACRILTTETRRCTSRATRCRFKEIGDTYPTDTKGS